MKPRVSVIMPVYNGERFIAEAVDSILKQSFDDFELIIVDDASSDRSWSIMSAYAARDPRIRLVRNPANLGEARARNAGLAVAEGDYIAVQDADDISFLDRLAIQVAYLDAHPQAGAVCSPAKRIDAEGRVTSVWNVPREPWRIRALLLLNNPLPHTTGMIRHSLLKQLGGYRPKVASTPGDYNLWWQISRISEIHTLPEPVAYYRSDDKIQGRITVGHSSRQLRGAQAMSLQIAQEIMADRPLDEAAYQRFFLSSRGIRGSLQPEDIRRLRPLWDALAADSTYRQVLGPKLLTSSLKNLLAHPREALALLVVARRQFGLSWAYILKRSIRYWLDTRPLASLSGTITSWGQKAAGSRNAWRAEPGE